MKKLFLSTIILLFSASFCLQAAPYDIIPSQDPIVDDLRFLSLETGLSFLSYTPPFSPDEIRQFINKIDKTLLSLPARDAYNRINDRLNPSANISYSADWLSVSFNINATLEGVLNFNDEIDIYPYNHKATR